MLLSPIWIISNEIRLRELSDIKVREEQLKLSNEIKLYQENQFILRYKDQLRSYNEAQLKLHNKKQYMKHFENQPVNEWNMWTSPLLFTPTNI